MQRTKTRDENNSFAVKNDIRARGTIICGETHTIFTILCLYVRRLM